MRPPTPTPLPDKPSAHEGPGSPGNWVLQGNWTLKGLQQPVASGELPAPGAVPAVLDGAALHAMDSAGAWVLRGSWPSGTAAPALRGWPARAAELMAQVLAYNPAAPAAGAAQPLLRRTGVWAMALLAQAGAWLHFLGELAVVAFGPLRGQDRWRWRAVAHELQIGGFNAMPIVGLTSFLLGVVVAYQGAEQLRHYGANVFVVELLGFAMLREFAPLMVAIVIAGRSGSAYAAQIGTMQAADEIDALRTIGIDPLQRLVLPKLLALALALPLLTLFADMAGVFGGMVMARWRLDIGFVEFIERFGRVMQGSALLLGLGKSVVFAAVIATVGCFEGLRAGGTADSVGQQTTRAVVQAIFLVIVVDAAFSVAFNMLDL